MANEAGIEYTSCPLCYSGEQNNVYAKFAPYAVVQCRSCGFYYLSPRLAETVMRQIYKDTAYFENMTIGYDSYVEQENTLRATFRRLLIHLKKRNLTGGALLEVGCGYGYLLEEAQGFFDEQVGTEFSPGAVEQARGRADRVYEGGVDQIPTNEHFDCIITTHVIEHVYHPRVFLEQLCKHLKSEGKIIIATPDMGSLWRHLMGHRWPSFKIPEHVLYFDRKSLSTLMRQAGLVISFAPLCR
jgi:SAM-dependent methyltransferase